MDNDEPPRGLRWRSSTLFIMAVVWLAIFTDVFVYGLVVPALPYVLKALLRVGAGETQEWVAILLSVYGFANAAFSPVFGYLGDRGNTRLWTFMLSLVAMLGSMLLFAASTSKVFLVVARVLQGMAAAGVWTVGLAIVVDTVKEDRIGTAMGYVSLAMTSGNVLGPMCGGILFDQGGLNAITVTAVSLILLSIILRMVMVEVQSARKWDVNDGMAEEVRRADQYGTFPDRSTINSRHTDSIDHCEAATCTDAGTFSLLASRRFIVIMIGICIASAFYSAFDTILPLQTIRVFKWTATGNGLVFLPLSAPALFSPILGRAVDKYGTRIVALAGFALGLPCFAALSLVVSNNLGHKILMCIALFLTGACLMAQMVPLMTEVSKVVDRKDDSVDENSGNGRIAMGYGLFNAAYAAGILFGALLGGLVCEQAGWKVTTWMLGIISAVTAIPFWLCTDIGLSSSEVKDSLSNGNTSPQANGDF